MQAKKGSKGCIYINNNKNIGKYNHIYIYIYIYIRKARQRIEQD